MVAGPVALNADSAGRYHLYVSLACPWAHRALIVRQLKGLEEFIGMSHRNSPAYPRGRQCHDDLC